MTETGRRPRVALIGECMIELREMFDGALSRGYGGDVLNTSVYLARLMGDDATVRFVTVLGDDPFADEMLADWAREGIACDAVGRMAGRATGLYVIRTDAAGERTFHYWRGQSPAREMMTDDWTDLRRAAFAADWIYLSGVTLAVIGEAGRARLVDELAAARAAGATVVFDGNFRPILWPDPADARVWHDRVWRLTGLALAGVEDEARIFGDATPEATVARLAEAGIPEIVLKRGPQPVLIRRDGREMQLDVEPATEVVDTTAAGDSFNAGYLAARIRGRGPLAAAGAGARLAVEVIRHPGAIIPAENMPAEQDGD
ncbi:MAG: sugar kinase [Rhodospirillaceae bacterium]